MLQKLRGNNSKGFTLIELMIVIAIIGILAAIAIPNFIAYRNKAFCSAAESDAHATASGIADYYAIPNHTAAVLYGDLTLTPSATNTVVISGTVNALIITVTDGSGRCPADYQASQTPQWSGANVFTLGM